MILSFSRPQTLRAAVCLLFTALALVSAPQALAATPASGTLSDTTPTLTYSVPAFTSVNASPIVEVDNGPRCNTTGFPCDSFKLTASIPASYIAANPYALVRVTLSWDTAASDYGLHIFEGDKATTDGTQPAPYGAETSNNPEIGYIDPVAGTSVYTIKVTPNIITPADKITVKVELLATVPDPCVPGGVLGRDFGGYSPSLEKYLAVPGQSGVLGGFLHFAGGSKAEQDALLKKTGLLIAGDYRSTANSVYVQGPVAAFRLLAGSPLIGSVEKNAPMQYFGGSGTWASRVRVAQEPAAGGPYYDSKGNRLTGKGTTVCVVDSGLDAPHPDFASRVLHNYKVAGAGTGPAVPIVDLGQNGDSDTTGGHGTHCAGIAAGSGASSIGAYAAAAKPNNAGSYTGSAPEANIVAYGSGETLLIFTAAQAFQHIFDNYVPTAADRIRVVSNSYGSTGPYSPGDTMSCLVRSVIKKNISVVFAAGNSAGDGSYYTTSPACKDPTPGVICVASYDDGQTGAINNPLSSFSSRGTKGRPYTYPDIAAPGSNITSTCLQPQPGQAVCATGAETKWQPYYGTISGTSMATPHVAGAIALLYQAKPDITPVEVERLIQNTARKVGTNGAYEPDPQNPGGSINFGFGAGLLDLPAALDSLGIKHGNATTGSLGPVLGAEYTIFDGDTDATVTNGAGDVTKLTMQEQSGSPSGVIYRLTLASGTSVGSGYTYAIEQDVNGFHAVTKLALNSAGASKIAASPDNNAPASSVTLAGNVLTVFVPYSVMGSPPINAPIHEIRVVVKDSMGNDADYAPSPATVPAAIAANQPSYGRPFTVTVLATPDPNFVPESYCLAPGVTTLTDPQGDLLSGIAPAQNNTPFYDVRALSITQPYAASNITDFRVDFYLKMSGLATLPANATWPINFCAPNFPCTDTNAAFSDTNKYYTVRMQTTTSPAAATYEVLQPQASGTAKTTVTANVVGSYLADGTIKISVRAQDIGLSVAGIGTQQLSKFLVRINAGGVTPDNMPDGLAGAGLYAPVALNFCAANTAPLARLLADKASGPAPLEVNFTGATSSDPDAGDSIASYRFDFGDGTPPLTQTAATATHGYTTAGNYTATLSVTDNRQKASATVASVAISVAKAGTSTPTTPVIGQATPATPAKAGSGDGRYGGAPGLLLLLPLWLLSGWRRRKH